MSYYRGKFQTLNKAVNLEAAKMSHEAAAYVAYVERELNRSDRTIIALSTAVIILVGLLLAVWFK